MPSARSAHAAATDGNQLYVMGGIDDQVVFAPSLSALVCTKLNGKIKKMDSLSGRVWLRLIKFLKQTSDEKVEPQT